MYNRSTIDDGTGSRPAKNTHQRPPQQANKISEKKNNKTRLTTNDVRNEHEARRTTTNPSSSSTSQKQQQQYQHHQQQQQRRPPPDILSDELRQAIQHLVANISKSFIVDWYTSISDTNHDFVASCDGLIDEVMTKLAELCIVRLDKYKMGQLLISLLHDHVLNENSTERAKSIENQIDNFEYDICQNSVVRLFGLLSNEKLRRVVFTLLKTHQSSTSRFAEPSQRQSSINHRPNGQQQQASYKKHSRSSSYSAYPASSSSSTNNSHHPNTKATNRNVQPDQEIPTKTTSALYTLVIAMLTKAAFMPIIAVISQPNWLYALIIWLCQKEEREMAKREEELLREKQQREERESLNHNDGDHGKRMFSTNSKSNRQMLPPPQPPIIVTRTCRSIDLEEGINIASPSINFDNPICDSLKRPLDNIEIYATEEVKSTGSCYVLYCIRYDGLCYRHPSASFNFIPEQLDKPIIDKRQMNATNRRLHGAEPSSSNATTNFAHEPDNRKSFRRSMTIKRRFREFVLLQLRLEENPKIRPYMKNIPKPTKLKAATQNIFSLPGITNIKLDRSTIKLRQRFLERFLVALNNSPFIANSYEFKEFFSYNLNPAGATMSRSKSTILQVNLNKVFVDSVRSAFSIIRSTLPGDDYQSLRANPDPDAWLTELQQSTLKLHIQTRTSHSKMNLERYIDSKLLTLGDSPTRSSKSSSLGRNYHQRGAFDWMPDSRGGSLKSRLLSEVTNCNSSHSISNSTTTSQQVSRSSSNSQPFTEQSNSRSSSTESIYHDAISGDPEAEGAPQVATTDQCNTIQICDSVPIATKFIDIIHYSISKNNECPKSPINLMARFILGKTIERYAIKLLEAALTVKNAAFCLNGITSSIWDESDDPPLDVENASLDEAVLLLTKLIESNYVSHTFIPKQLMTRLISNQIRFYLSQLASQKSNKFVIYSFFVHLLDELEVVDQQQPQQQQQ